MILLIELSPENAPVSIVVTVLGITILCNFKFEEKALFSIFLTPSSIINSVRLLASTNE